MTTSAALVALQQEVVYGTSWLSQQRLGTCSAFQSLYETESCCSSATLQKEFVVFERPDATCDLGWRAVTLGGATRCLKLHPNAVWTKAEANAACVSEGAELVQPKTADDNTLVQGLVDGLDAGATNGWQYFWVGVEQHPTATEPAAGWAWDDGTAVTNFGWHTGQPTVYTGASDDGPEDCVLYRKGAGWYDFGCSPSARVACMVPYFNFGGSGMCWGVATGEYDEPSPPVESGGNQVCLKLLGDSSYNIDLARTACGAVNGQLYYPTTATESASFASWVYATTGDAKVWINLAQDSGATDPGQDWATPMGTYFPHAEIPWGASDPEPSEPAWPSQDFIHLIVTSTGGVFQDVTRMTDGAGALCVKDAPVA